ncbi:Hypp7249 [Branchiostoma lanceolatum]|uniref:Hypp7249 protein n=1 Tax=Branchiostoma lanceolatum TaxID=7740 RepID=A0A8J9YZ87_BRALA|nr:Hypp7249 [Branchiostoma lanceolatum]
MCGSFWLSSTVSNICRSGEQSCDFLRGPGGVRRARRPALPGVRGANCRDRGRADGLAGPICPREDPHPLPQPQNPTQPRGEGGSLGKRRSAPRMQQLAPRRRTNFGPHHRLRDSGLPCAVPDAQTAASTATRKAEGVPKDPAMPSGPVARNSEEKRAEFRPARPDTPAAIRTKSLWLVAQRDAQNRPETDRPAQAP